MGIHERKQREKEQRKAEILDAARKIFSKKGFNSATMEEIATQAELSPGTLYLYFKNKEELHTYLSIEVLKRLVTETEKLAKLDIPVGKKIEKLLNVFYELYDYDPSILINLLHLQSGETLQNLSDEVLKQIIKYSSMAHRAAGDVVKQGIKEGIFIDEHPGALVDILWGSFSGIVLWVDSKRLINTDKAFVKSTLKTAFKILERGSKK